MLSWPFVVCRRSDAAGRPGRGHDNVWQFLFLTGGIMSDWNCKVEILDDGSIFIDAFVPFVKDEAHYQKIYSICKRVIAPGKITGKTIHEPPSKNSYCLSLITERSLHINECERIADAILAVLAEMYYQMDLLQERQNET